MQSGYKITGEVDESGEKLTFVFTEIEVVDESNVLGDLEEGETGEAAEHDIENADGLNGKEKHDETTN